MTEKNELANRFFELESLLRRYYARKAVKEGPAGSIHRGQGRLLTLLTMQPEISQKDLAYILGMRPQSVGELLGKLEKNEWITRTPSTEDRRVMIISLTEKGQEAAAKLVKESQAGSELFDIFSEDEQGNLLGYVDRLIEKLSAEVGEDPEGRKAFMERFGGPEFFKNSPHHRHPRPEPPFEKRFGFEGRRFGPEEGCGHHPNRPQQEPDEWNDF